VLTTHHDVALDLVAKVAAALAVRGVRVAVAALEESCEGDVSTLERTMERLLRTEATVHLFAREDEGWSAGLSRRVAGAFLSHEEGVRI